MKLFLVTAATAALMLASPAAFAQDHHEHGGSHNGGGHESGGHQGGSHGGGDHKAPAAAPARPAAAPARSAAAATPRPSNTTSWAAQHGAKVKTSASPGAVYNNAVKNNNRNDNNRNNDRHDNNNNRHDNDRHDNNWNNNNNRHDNDRHDNNWNNNRHDNNRGSWQGRFNRRNVTASHHYRYRGNSWRWPSGYHYQRWSFGMTLPSIFWAQNYWISDYSNYGLGYPPPGTVWVRYNDDAILIDRYTGEILEVVYDQFD